MLRSLSKLPIWLCIFLPLALWGGQLALDIVTPPADRPALYSEGGPHEIVEVFFLLSAFIVGCLLFRKALYTHQPLWYRVWIVLAIAGCFYVAGEELSWGQWVFRWQTPEYWAALNDQGETNLHNVSTWLDQKPRAILELGIIVGGLLFPVLRRWRPNLLPAKFAAIYPVDRLIFVAFMAEFAKWGDAFFKNVMGQQLFERASEVQELYFFMFVLLYLVSLYGVDVTRPSHQSGSGRSV
jgi:hypothetical protein